MVMSVMRVAENIFIFGAASKAETLMSIPRGVSGPVNSRIFES